MNYCKYLKLFAFIFILTASLSGAPGDLDPTFGRVGFGTKAFSGQDRASSILVQTDGKFIVVGADSFSFAPIITLVRYNANGSLDTTFSGDGVAQVSNGHAFDAKLQADGKIVVAGTYVEGGTALFAVSRFNADGSLDTSFAGDGIFADPAITQGIARAVAIQADGKIVATGNGVGNDFSSDYATLRLNTDGTPDTSFNGSGRVLTPVRPTNAGGLDEGFAVIVQGDGKIVIGGESQFFTLVRYNTNGSLDTSFDGDGIAQTNFSGFFNLSRLRGLAIDQSGRIVASGFANDDTIQGFGFARYNTDGSLDTTFSGDGKFITPLGITASDVKIQPDGKIIAAGSGSGESNITFTIVRLNPNGTIDTDFGEDGKVSTQIFDGGNASIESLELDSNGNIFVAGYGGKSGGGSDDDFAFAKYNPDGMPSSTLGIFGYITQNILNEPTRSSVAAASATQADGKIVVVGSQQQNQDQSYGVIIRYRRGGRLDTSFGSSSASVAGFVTVGPPNSTTSELSDVVIQPDGKILAVGSYEGSSDAGLFMVRLNANGERDLQFGGNNSGYATLGVLSGGALGRNIKLSADGKILVAGATANIITQQIKFAVFRFNANGSRDTTFGSSGIATTSFSASNDLALSLDIQTDGKIIASGASNFDLGSNGSLAVARFNSNGSIDASFGSGGRITANIGSFIDLAADVKSQADGKTVIGGVSCTDGNCVGGNGFIFRYNANGSPDTTFNGNGRVFIPASSPGLSTGISSIAVQTDGKILGGGVIANSVTSEDALLVRFNADGSPDSGFGSNGIVSSDIGNTDQLSNSIDLQPDGKIVSVGSSASGARTDFAVWRYLGDSPTFVPDGNTLFDFDGDRKTDISIFRPASGEWWYLRSSDGSNRVFTFGTSSDKLVPADFTGDGKADIAIWRESSGEWFILRSEDSSFYSIPFGTAGDIPAPGDFDGDGIADVTIFRPSNSTWYILNSSGGTTISQFGTSEDKPVVADYDGDGKDDIAIFRPSVSQWWISRSSAGVVVYQFGQSGDQNLPADYTGDGKADIAFFRPSSGEWFILRSEDSSFYSFPFGTAGDTPAPGDFDGDGITDPAVFRPSNNTWYKLQSGNGFEAITFGVSGDLPIPNVFVR